jgi:membrane protease YdiL (CAAX protease family)
MKSFELLPLESSFRNSLWPFAAPYFGYVAGKSLQPFIGPDLSALLALIACGVALAVYRKSHPWSCFSLHEGAFSKTLLWGLGAALPLTALWIFLLWIGMGSAPFATWAEGEAQYSLSYGFLRILGSVLLVPLAEEFFLRVWALEFFQSAFSKTSTGRISGIGTTLDQKPTPLPALPLGWAAQITVSLLFALGHSPTSFLAAFGYFMATNWLYAQSKSLAAVIVTHALVNGVLAYLVLVLDWHWLWA